jgi:hypothetical protein
MNWSYIEVESARSKPIFQKCHTLRQKQTAQAARAERFTGQGEGAVPTNLPWPAARAQARAPLFGVLARVRRPPMCGTGCGRAGILRPRFGWIQGSALPAGTEGGEHRRSGGAGSSSADGPPEGRSRNRDRNEGANCKYSDRDY